jgi:hypothetical protein
VPVFSSGSWLRVSLRCSGVLFVCLRCLRCIPSVGNWASASAPFFYSPRCEVFLRRTRIPMLVLFLCRLVLFYFIFYVSFGFMFIDSFGISHYLLLCELFFLLYKIDSPQTVRPISILFSPARPTCIVTLVRANRTKSLFPQKSQYMARISCYRD